MNVRGGITSTIEKLNVKEQKEKKTLNARGEILESFKNTTEILGKTSNTLSFVKSTVSGDKKFKFNYIFVNVEQYKICILTGILNVYRHRVSL